MKLINYYTIVTGGIKIETSPLKTFDIYPINIKVINKLNGKICYEVNLTENMWAQSHPFIDQSYILIKDKNDNILLKKDLDNFIDGDTVENYFDIWSKSNPRSIGIVAGANDGTTGEWVDLVRDNKLKAILLEPLEEACLKLKQYYKNNSNVEIFNYAINLTNEKIKLYAQKENDGVCSTVMLEQAKNSPFDFTNFQEQIVNSFSVKYLLEKYEPKWFHTDLEGFDYDIILEILKYNNLHPEIILYEHYHMNNEQYAHLESEFSRKGYVNIKGERLNSIAIKKQNN